MSSRRPSYRRNRARVLRNGASVSLSIRCCFFACFVSSLITFSFAAEEPSPGECPHCKTHNTASSTTSSAAQTETAPQSRPGLGIPFYNPFPAVYEKSCAAVVSIQGDKVEDGDGSWESSRNAKLYKGMGTGIIIDPRGYIITNHHVIAEIRKIQVTTHDKKTYTAMLIGKDLETDLALIKILPEAPLQSIKLGHSGSIRTCDYVLAIGNPFGYDFTGTIGVISHLGRDVEVDDTLVYRDAIQIDVSINPGNSGGPLLNTQGEMIGINVAIRQGADRTAFAMPVDQVVAVVAKLIGEHTGRSVYHGIEIVQTETCRAGTHFAKSSPDATDEKADQERPQCGLVVADVEPGSPAERAGIKPGDSIAAVNEKEISTELEFRRALIGMKMRDEINVALVREGESERQQVSVALSSPKSATAKTTEFMRSRSPLAPSRAETGGKVGRPMDDPIWNALGFQANPLSKEEFQRRYSNFLISYPGGVVIKAIKADSPFATAGVRVGDVLVGFHLWTVVSQKDLLFIGKEWTTLTARGRNNQGRDSIRIYLLRGNEHFYQDIPLKKGD